MEYIEEIEKGKIITISYSKKVNNIDVTYTYALPSPSKYDFSEADVDKEGSGRNEMTGTMYRDRLGKYCKINVSWDLIPNTSEYVNCYKVLSNLPDKFTLTYLTPSGDLKQEEAYRSDDLSTSLYLFVDKNKHIWQGLSTSFTSWNISEYSEEDFEDGN